MPNYICVTCGNQYAVAEQPPSHCLICEDERRLSTLKVKPGSQLRCCSANTAMSSGRLNHACSGLGLSQSLPSGNVHCLCRAPAVMCSGTVSV